MQKDTKKTTWIIIDPVDTLFFRGAESMVAGENHEVDTLFPPMPQTIIGAIRSAVMGQAGISPQEYFASPEQHPFLGPPDMPGFSLVGPLFLVNGEMLLLPVPANWHADLPDAPPPELTVQAATPLTSNSLGLKGSVNTPFWVRQPEHDNLKSLAGWWTTVDTFRSMAAGHTRIQVATDISSLCAGTQALVPQTALYDREERLGIALTDQRTAKDGHLYTTVHIRLRPGVELAANIITEHKISLADTGIIQLGGEQRLCRYRLRHDIDLPPAGGSGMMMSLSPLDMDRLSGPVRQCPRSSGKIFRIGGWDMKKGFHKPMRAWLPPGTVFATNGHNPDNFNFIAI